MTGEGDMGLNRNVVGGLFRNLEMERRTFQKGVRERLGKGGGRGGDDARGGVLGGEFGRRC